MSAGDDIPLDAVLIDAYRMGLEQGLNAGLSAAGAACMKARFPLRIVDGDIDPPTLPPCGTGPVRFVWGTPDDDTQDGIEIVAADIAAKMAAPAERVEGAECTTDAVADFFYHAEQLATSRGFRRLSVRYSVRKGDDEICYEVDGDVNLTPDP